MSLRDVLIYLESYPDPTDRAATDQATAFAATYGAKLSAITVEALMEVRSNVVAEYLIGLSGMAEAEREKSRQACREALSYFRDKAQAAKVLGDAIHVKAGIYFMAEAVAAEARGRDLCLIPVGDPFDGQRSVAAQVVFDSGRPVLVFAPGAADLKSRIGKAVVAWDGSRSAARAINDALPLLEGASQVSVLTLVNDKPTAVRGLGETAVRHLKAHGVPAVAKELDVEKGSARAMIADYALGAGADLLVMGAYGHSRAREFILGGATEEVLQELKTPVLFSH
jgi:nucleotide-binding universal stress UspA family protein